tara:strand:+ start:4452 stop:5228 length:777 start_codon:yes stop_codon:yes gene_type:complete
MTYNTSLESSGHLTMRSILENKSVALVGPSASLIDQNLGEDIDSHDIVVRMNTYHHLLNNTKDYGSKVDIVYHCFWQQFPVITPTVKLVKSSYPVKNIKNNKIIGCGFSLIPLDGNEKCFDSFYAQNNNEELRIESYDIDTYLQCCNVLSDPEMWVPTTGSCTIYDLFQYLSFIEKISIYGINFMIPESGGYNLNYSNVNSHYKNGINGAHNIYNEANNFKKFYNQLSKADKEKVEINDVYLYNFVNNIQPSVIEKSE